METLEKLPSDSRIHVLDLYALAYFSSDGSFGRCFLYDSVPTLLDEHAKAVAAGNFPLTFCKSFYLLPGHPLYNHKDCHPLSSKNKQVKLF